MAKMTPNIMVTDVNATVSYYEQNLEFEMVMGVDEAKETKIGDYKQSNLIWAMIRKDDIELMFQRKDSFIEELPEFKGQEIGGTFTLYIYAEDIKNFYNKIKDKVKIIKEIHKTFYGADEFVMKDLNGYIIYFGETQDE